MNNRQVIKIPHVVVEGEMDLRSIFNELEDIFIKKNGDIIRTSNRFISQDETTILVEILVIEKAEKKQFFGIISKRDDGIVVRIYPGTEVEKTNNVKRSLAELGKQILSKFEGTKIGKTNLTEFL